MLSSVQAGQNTHDDYVKHLLDQRTARTDFRFSTPSDFSDTPSIYSRSFFSPRPQANGGPVSPLNGHTSHDNITPGNSVSLDPDDTNDSSHGSNYPTVPQNREAEEDLDIENMSHMSMLGPKMRFHSRAPWETEDDASSEGDETVSPLEYPAKSRFFNLVPSSPRFGNLGRPSAESTRSEVARKMSTEGNASKGRSSCHTFRLSDISLSRSYNGSRQDVMQQSPSSSLSQSSMSTPSPPRGTSLNQRFSTEEQTIEFETRSEDNVPMFGEGPMSSEPHPYANPDLIAYTTESDDCSSQASVDLIGKGSATLMGSSFSSSASKCDTVSNLTQTISNTPISPLKPSFSALHGVQISTPLAVVGHTLQGDKGPRCNTLPLSGVQKLPGWMDKANTPSFSLISLEEARAQRAKNTTQVASVEDGNSLYPHLASAVQSPQHNTIIQRTRARSISAGTKAKNALHSAVKMHSKPDKRDPDPQANLPFTPGKSVRHKKSGLMRLLGGSKTSSDVQPPPVPVLPDSYESQSHSHRSYNKLHRVPVPKFNVHDTVNGDISVQLAKSAISRKRTPPPLSISSNAIKNMAQPVSSTIEISPRAQSVMMDSSGSPWTDTSPHSAPAHVLDFPALQLRPVSTLFSAKFSEHLASSSEVDSDTPRTSGPTTPISLGPSIHELSRAVPASASLEDQSDVIRTLQDHIISSKLTWQRQIWELEGQIRDLRIEVEHLKAAAKEDYCEACGRGKLCIGDSVPNSNANQPKTSVVDRPRVQTGISSRFGNSTA